MRKLISNQKNFIKLAERAAINHYKSGMWWSKKTGYYEILECIRRENKSRNVNHNPTFTEPTDHPLGYWNVLNTIAKSNGITRRELHEKFKHNLTLVLSRLQCAELISLGDDHKFKATMFGERYIQAVKNIINTHIK